MLSREELIEKAAAAITRAEGENGHIPKLHELETADRWIALLSIVDRPQSARPRSMRPI